MLFRQTHILAYASLCIAFTPAPMPQANTLAPSRSISAYAPKLTPISIDSDCPFGKFATKKSGQNASKIISEYFDGSANLAYEYNKKICHPVTNIYTWLNDLDVGDRFCVRP